MVAPHLDTEHPGIRVIAEVASVLQAGAAAGGALRGGGGGVRPGLHPRRCRVGLGPPAGHPRAPRPPEMEAQRGFAAQIIDSLPVGLYVIDRGYRIRAWNRKRETGTQGVSREDAVGREVFEVLDRQPRDLLKREFDRVFDTGEIQQAEMESAASGETRHYRITKIPMRQDGQHISHVITIGEDITEWRQAQQRLSETEKLAAVGQLAAGVMHEINNPLATILACCEALALRTGELSAGDRHGYDEYLKIVDTEVQRCRRIVDSLLDFSRSR